MERSRDSDPDHILQVDSEAFLNTPYFPPEFFREHPSYLLHDLIANGNTVLRECLF